MDLRHLQYFATAAEVGSISRAAALLSTSQPSLSRQIRSLEENLGTPLLLRSAHGVRTTAAGAGLLLHYQRIKSELERVPEVVRAAAGGETILRVGLPPGLPSTWFTEAQERLSRDAPLIVLDLADLASPDQEKALDRSDLDVGFMHYEPAGYVTRLALSQNLGIAWREDTVWADGENDLADMDGATVLAHTSWEVSGQTDSLRRLASASGIRIDWRYRQYTEHVSLVAASCGAAGVLSTQTTARRALPDWRWVALKPAPGLPDDAFRLTTWLVHGHAPAPGVDELVRAILGR